MRASKGQKVKDRRTQEMRPQGKSKLKLNDACHPKVAVRSRYRYTADVRRGKHSSLDLWTLDTGTGLILDTGQINGRSIRLQ